MNTKGKIDFTKTDNIQFIEEVARFGETEDCPFWENKYKEENA